MTNKEIKIPYYKGNIKLTKAVGLVTLEQFINIHKNPKPETVAIMELVKEASRMNDLKLKRELKHRLFAFTPAVEIEVGVARKYVNIKKWTGLMQIDMDGISDYNEAVEIKNLLFNNYNQIVCCYISPSGKGVKALLKTKVPKTVEEYRNMHSAVEKEFEQYNYFDSATKNAVLPLFLSYDEDILYRDYNECDEWIDELIEDKTRVQLNDKPNFNPSTKSNSEEQYNYNKVIRIFTTRINAIVDNGHPQLRTACLILGSRASAGYIHKIEAEQLSKCLIEQNQYLSKNVQGYIETANWAIEEGYKSPKYF